MGENVLFDIAEVRELDDPDIVNQLLTAGWKLLAAYTRIPYQDEPQNLRLIYSVGRPSSIPPVSDPPRYGWD